MIIFHQGSIFTNMKRRKRLPKSIRKHIRQEKARLRREFLDIAEQNKRIKDIYERLAKKQPK